MAKVYVVSQIVTKILTFRPHNHRRLYTLTKQANSAISQTTLSGDLNSFFSFRYNQTKVLRCWKCGVEKSSVKDVFCPKCNFIQEPYETKNYFKLLDVDEIFDLDVKTLTNKYRRLQNAIHPDKFSSRSVKEKDISQEYSSLINKAYNTLQYPLNRALHMLQLRGERIDEDEKIADAAFLMEIMELNEEIEAAANNAKELKALNEKNKKNLNELCKYISESFEKGDVEKAKEYVVKMKYYTSVSHHINRIMREKGIVD